LSAVRAGIRDRRILAPDTWNDQHLRRAPASEPMKKYIGLALWLLAFLIPFRYALLSTEDVGNITGLLSFVVFLALVFIGYALVDSAPKATEGGHHGH